MAGPVKFNYKHANANSATAVVLSPNAGSTFHCVSINTKGATANTLTLHDSATATVSANTQIAVIDTTAGVTTLFYDIIVANGLAYVLNTGTAADVTIAWS